MITKVDWQGELDGEVVLTVVSDDDASESSVVIDRPGDLVSRMMTEEFATDEWLDVAAMYGYCLASRGITEPLFVDQIVRKIGPFLRSARIDSLPLYRLTERISDLVRDSGTEGVELRELLLDEAHKLRSAQ